MGSGKARDSPSPTLEDSPDGSICLKARPQHLPFHMGSLHSGRAGLCAQPQMTLSTCDARLETKHLCRSCGACLGNPSRDHTGCSGVPGRQGHRQLEEALRCQLSHKMHVKGPTGSRPAHPHLLGQLGPPSFPSPRGCCPGKLHWSRHVVPPGTGMGPMAALNRNSQLSKFSLHGL